MPIYEYRCEDCGGTFEALTPFADRARARACPACESSRTRVLVSSFAAIGASAEVSSGPPMASSGGGCACGGACACRN